MRACRIILTEYTSAKIDCTVSYLDAPILALCVSCIHATSNLLIFILFIALCIASIVLIESSFRDAICKVLSPHLVGISEFFTLYYCRGGGDSANFVKIPEFGFCFRVS